jgi:hypothetical protein
MGTDYFALFQRPPGPGPEPVGGAAPGVTVLIPTYSPAERERTAGLRLCVDSVRRSAPAGCSVALLIVDNGLSAGAARDLADLLRAAGLPHAVVAAGAGPPSERYTAARARNVGLGYLADQPEDSPLRRRNLLFLDDDTALAPTALAHLLDTLDGRPEAVAACPRVVPVADPAAWLRDRRAGSDAGPRRLPGPLVGPRYDLLSVTAHGSLVTGRTVGLLVRQGPVLAWIREHGPLFFEGTPYGSGEDMLAMAMLSRIGELWSAPAAEVADEARATPGATRRQQFAWGYDHAWLVRRLAGAGLLDPGVRGLTWTGDGWEETARLWGPRTGVLVNPAEVRMVLHLLGAITEDPGVARDMFGADAEKVSAGTGQLARVLALWRATAPTAVRRPRPDLPLLAGRGWASLRDGLDALTGHLAGNVAGTFDDGPDPEGIPLFFLYGARQPAGAAPLLDEKLEMSWTTGSASSEADSSPASV